MGKYEANVGEQRAAAATVAALKPAWEKRAADLAFLADEASKKVEEWRHAAAQQRGLLTGSEAVLVAGAARAARVGVIAEVVAAAALRLRAAAGELRAKLTPPAPGESPPPTLDHLHKVQSDCEANLAKVAAQELEQSR